MLDLDWEVLIRPAQTVAIYMGVSNLPLLVEGFERHGVSMQTDIALIENGTRPNQRVITGTLARYRGEGDPGRGEKPDHDHHRKRRATA